MGLLVELDLDSWGLACAPRSAAPVAWRLGAASEARDGARPRLRSPPLAPSGVYLMLSVVLLMNMLIAQMSKTFDTVWEAQARSPPLPLLRPPPFDSPPLTSAAYPPPLPVCRRSTTPSSSRRWSSSGRLSRPRRRLSRSLGFRTASCSSSIQSHVAAGAAAAGAGAVAAVAAAAASRLRRSKGSNGSTTLTWRS